MPILTWTVNEPWAALLVDIAAVLHRPDTEEAARPIRPIQVDRLLAMAGLACTAGHHRLDQVDIIVDLPDRQAVLIHRMAAAIMVAIRRRMHVALRHRTTPMEDPVGATMAMDRLIVAVLPPIEDPPHLRERLRAARMDPHPMAKTAARPIVAVPMPRPKQRGRRRHSPCP